MTTNVAATPLPVFMQLLGDEIRWRIVTLLTRSDRRAQELGALLGQPANLVSYHLKRLAQAHVVRQRHSAADRRAIYYSLNLPQVQALFVQTGQALHPALAEAPTPAKPEAQDEANRPEPPLARLLFLCTHNSARSQMAEAITRHISLGRVEVFSAGTEPTELHPLAIQVMEARGIPLRGQQAKPLDQFVGEPFDYIITTCDIAREVCPTFPGDPEQIHWSFPDPAAVEGTQARLKAFQTIATELTTRINYLLLLISVEHGKKLREGKTDPKRSGAGRKIVLSDYKE
jgi:protein-tyrosine-phosphatase